MKRLGQGKNTVGQLLLVWSNIQMLNAYRVAIMNAVADLPSGTNLILVGYRQGGMEAQNVVENLVGCWGYRVPMEISDGRPSQPCDARARRTCRYGRPTIPSLRWTGTTT